MAYILPPSASPTRYIASLYTYVCMNIFICAFLKKPKQLIVLGLIGIIALSVEKGCHFTGNVGV